MLSLKFKNSYLGESVSITSKNEKIKSKYKIDKYFIEGKNVEDTEIEMANIIINDLSKKYKIDLILGSDLSNQLGITNSFMKEFPISYFGIYSACSSYVEELILSSIFLTHSQVNNLLSIVTSHNLESERTFRYPIEYGSPRRDTQTFTATASVGTIVQKEKTNIKIESCTIGKVVNYGIKDVNNMGAVMAPAAAETLLEHLKYFRRTVDYYDIILTGDLGILGSSYFKKILKENDITIKNHLDAGSILISDKNLTTQGASGPTCLPLILTEKILKSKKYKKILLIGTGALFNNTMVNQKKELPSIAHIVSLEII